LRCRWAVFLDRDGVLIRDVHLLSNCENIELFDYAPKAICELKIAGFSVIVVTNQTVIARGLASENDVIEMHSQIQCQLWQKGGAGIDRFYFCPHHPNADIQEYRMECDCRKPKPGMLLRAAQDLDIDLSHSWMVGDRISDIVAGKAAKCRTVLVETGMHAAPPIDSVSPEEQAVSPDYTCADLANAVQVILRVTV
jgi:D-glycero-D-manno-heptose 1,7-bisphosphate phosphatase